MKLRSPLQIRTSDPKLRFKSQISGSDLKFKFESPPIGLISRCQIQMAGPRFRFKVEPLRDSQPSVVITAGVKPWAISWILYDTGIKFRQVCS